MEYDKSILTKELLLLEANKRLKKEVETKYCIEICLRVSLVENETDQEKK